ncbi:MAG: hydantoinase B/oxoprolinase family protein [Rhodospirillales bacterium]|jgi:N-methylhydantoinase B|nr:hydantoinase B/oxoprolinase family protein [Rhodospirillales bacterium]
MSVKIDPFQLEVIKNCFDAIADDMALTLMRTAHSGIVRDSMDFSTAICDADGRTLAQGVCTPMQLGGFYDAMRLMITNYESRIYPGDVFISNDPFAAAGQHLPDIYITTPIFYREALCGWSTTMAHHSDVGGIVAGSNALGSEEIFQEGLRLPVVKFVERGEPNQALWDVIALNVRTPDKVMGDLQAQMASCKSGERELIELFERYGVDTVLAYAAHLHEYAERLTRAEIRDIPDGVYDFVDHIDGLGENPETIYLKAKIIVEDDEITVDWTGSSPQVEGGINPSFPFTKAAAYAALRSVMSAEIPNCHGFSNPITVVAPKGCILNPHFPAPCGARGITGYRMIDCLFGALAKAVPDRVTADNNGGSTLPTIAGYRNGKAFVFCETFMGTWGATSAHDGQSGVPHMGANQSNVSIEMIESDYPIRIDEYGMAPDTGGPGRHRGGLALLRQYRILSDRAILNVRSDKRKYPPHGLYGGKEGSPSINLVNPGSEDRVLPVLMLQVEKLNKGDVFRHVMSGGGGFGDPLERDPEQVLGDVIEEKVTPDHARREYGVVIDASGAAPAIDAAATEALRAAMRKGP